MAINKANLIVVEGDLQPDATTVASLVISLRSTEVTEMPKISGCKVRVMPTKVLDIRAMVVAKAAVVGRPIDVQ